MTLKHIDLCSGIGGFALAFEQAGLSTPAMFCDIEPWCRKILAKHWPHVPIAHDVKELSRDPERLIPKTDPRNTILTSGYPCQPFSQAGARRGTSDSRHIYPYISEIIAHKRPAWLVLENVFGHLSLGLDEVLNDLANQNYAARPFIFPSGAIVGAPHHRKRVWIIARNVGNPAHNGCEGGSETTGREGQTHQQDEPRLEIRGELGGSSEDVADTQRQRQQSREHEERTRHKEGLFEGRCDDVSDTNDPRNRTQQYDTDAERQAASKRRQEQSQPQSSRYSDNATHRQPSKDQSHVKSRLGGMADGLPNWLDEPTDIPRIIHKPYDKVKRLQGLGNAIIPQIAMQIGLAIKRTIATE